MVQRHTKAMSKKAGEKWI